MLPVTCRTVQVVPASSDTDTAASLAQLLCGRYTEPSGATLTCPWMLPQPSVTSLYAGVGRLKVRPPVSLRAQRPVT